MLDTDFAGQQCARCMLVREILLKDKTVRALHMQVDVRTATNVLDRWISAASRSLTAFVRREMGAYRLYTVVPFLVQPPTPS